jgi:hypothetical protein
LRAWSLLIWPALWHTREGCGEFALLLDAVAGGRKGPDAEGDDGNSEQDQHASRQRARFETKKKSRRLVTLRDFDRLAPPTLRVAAEQLNALGGRVLVKKGRVLVECPPSELGANQYGEKNGSRLARVFYDAEATMVEAVTKDGEVKPGQLPARPLLPSGRVAP